MIFTVADHVDHRRHQVISRQPLPALRLERGGYPSHLGGLLDLVFAVQNRASVGQIAGLGEKSNRGCSVLGVEGVLRLQHQGPIMIIAKALHLLFGRENRNINGRDRCREWASAKRHEGEQENSQFHAVSGSNGYAIAESSHPLRFRETRRKDHAQRRGRCLSSERFSID